MMVPDETVKTDQASDAPAAVAPAPAATNWHERLAAAATPDEVASVCRDLVAWIAPEQLHALPAHCRPPAEVNTESIAEYALALVRCDKDLGFTGPPLLRELAIFFAAASDRIAEIAAVRSRRNRGLGDFRP
jgi:hypothetical protein